MWRNIDRVVISLNVALADLGWPPTTLSNLVAKPLPEVLTALDKFEAKENFPKEAHQLFALGRKILRDEQNEQEQNEFVRLCQKLRTRAFS